jgi:hypothetical protein
LSIGANVKRFPKMALDEAYSYSETTDYEEGYDTGGIEPAVSGSAWVTNGPAEFINSLCPNRGMQAFPHFDWVRGRERENLKDAFKYGFNAVQAHYRAALLERHYCGKPNAAELRTLYVIERKTFQFGKLMEKIPRRVFHEGERRRDGELVRERCFGTVVVPPAVQDDRTLSKGSNGLLRKGLITKVESDPHPRFGVSSIYCAVPILEAVQLILDRASVDFARIYPKRVTEVFDAIGDEINDRCSGLFTEARAEINRVRRQG